MAFDRPTLTELVSRIASDVTASITGAVTLALRSVLLILGRVFAGAVHLLYGYVDNQMLELFILTASTTGLDALGNDRGVPRNAAVQAVGTAGATGTSGKVIPVGTVLQSSAGERYTVDTLATIVAGVANIDVTAETAGADGNNVAGTILTFVSPIIGVDTSATVDSDAIEGGTDEETDDDYRQRLLVRIQTPPHGGAENDYIVWAKEVSGVTRAWLSQLYYGRGTLALFFVRDNDSGSRFPSASEIDDVLVYITEHTDATGRVVGAPVTAVPGLFILAPTPKTVDFQIAIYPNNSDVQDAIEAALEDLFLREAGPGQALYLSRISEAISSATDEARHTLITPSADVTAASNELQVVGDITWSNY